MELEGETAEGIWRVVREVYNRTSLSNTGLEQRDESRGKCIRLCYDNRNQAEKRLC